MTSFLHGLTKAHVNPSSTTTRRYRYFHVAAASLLIVIVMAGFAPTFYFRALFNGRVTPSYVHLHGVIMSAWCLLFLIQTCLIAAHHRKIHRYLGMAGVALAIAVVASGIYVQTHLAARVTAIPELPPAVLETLGPGINEVLVFGLLGMPVFAGFVTAGILLRGHRESHSRFMFWSFLFVTAPALTTNRAFGAWLIQFLPAAVEPVDVLNYGAVLLFLCYDWRSLGRIHTATIICALVINLLFPLAMNATLAYLESNNYACGTGIEQWFYHREPCR